MTLKHIITSRCGVVNYIDLLDGSDGSVTVEQVQTRTMSPIMKGHHGKWNGEGVIFNMCIENVNEFIDAGPLLDGLDTAGN
jgi:hypothetical protein